MLLKSFPRNLAGRDYVCGDIHFCYEELLVQLLFIGFNFRHDRLFCTGDLADRGPYPAYHSVLTWLQQPWFHPICGNHDEIAIRIGHGAAVTMESIQRHHTEWLLDYSPEERRIYADALNALPRAIEVDTEKGLIAIVHADIPTRTWGRMRQFLKQQDVSNNVRKSMIGAMQYSREKCEQGMKFIIPDLYALVVGHTASNETHALGNTFFADTGAGYPWGKITVTALDNLPI